MASSSSFEGTVLDPSKCSKLSMEGKRELIYQLSKLSHGAPEMLQSWSRQEILQVLCAEMGKERKYTGLTKLKIIENLFKIVSEKKSQDKGIINDLEEQPSDIGQRSSKRQRKTDHPNRLPVAASNVSIKISDGDLSKTVYCKNSACKAKLNQEGAFCKRCSCCICYKYDDNKDPSLWLTCSSEPPFRGDSCGISFHLECALKHERCGISKDNRLDGSFYCVSCGKVNDLLSCWRKQLIISRDTRRVDILCYRVSLSQKLLCGTTFYQKLYEIVEAAVKKLEDDVGPLTGLPVKMARGIVNRLSSGPEVQRLCALAVESLDSMLSNHVLNMPSNDVLKDSSTVAGNVIRFEDVCDLSLTVILGSDDSLLESGVGYSLWHRKANDTDYADEPTCTLFAPNLRYPLLGLVPATDYLFKVIYFDNTRDLGTCAAQCRTNGVDDKFLSPNMNLVVERSQSPPTNCSSLSNPSSVEDETNNVAPYFRENETQEDNDLVCCQDTRRVGTVNITSAIINCSGSVKRGAPGDGVSLLEDEQTTRKLNSVPKSDALNNENKDSPSPDDQTIEETSTDDGSNTPIPNGMECVPFVGTSEAELPITPCKLENIKDGPGRSGRPKLGNKDLDTGSGREDNPQAGSSSKKISGERREEQCAGIGDKDFEYYVKVIRWLECEGHVETTFRQKFLTWYSLRATPQEVRIVKVFINTLIEDPASLAGQLIDSFSDVISSKRSSVVPSGFCLKLWH